jgi:hypothetical protein
MEVSSHRQAPAALRRYPVNWRTVGWAPGPVSTLWEKKKILPQPVLELLTFQPVA